MASPWSTAEVAVSRNSSKFVVHHGHNYKMINSGHARRGQTPDGTWLWGFGQKVFGLDCMLSSCQRRGFEHQEQKGTNAARPVPRSQSLQGNTRG